MKAFRPIGRVFAIRRKRRLRETGGSISHPGPTTDSDESRLLSEAGNFIEFVSPMVQAAAEMIPIAGTPLKAAVDGLLYVIRMINVGYLFCITAFLLIPSQTTKSNKAALDNLASRLLRLLLFSKDQHKPRDEAEARRRMALAQCVFIFKSFSIFNDTARTEISKTSGANGLRCKDGAGLESHTIL